MGHTSDDIDQLFNAASVEDDDSNSIPELVWSESDLDDRAQIDQPNSTPRTNMFFLLLLNYMYGRGQRVTRDTTSDHRTGTLRTFDTPDNQTNNKMMLVNSC